MRHCYTYLFLLIFSFTLPLLVPDSLSGQDGVVWRTVKKDIRNDYPTVDQLNVDSLLTWMSAEKQLVLLDARKQEEYDISHIKNAVRIDPDIKETPEWLLDDSEKTVVVYCSVGYRSSKVADVLSRDGVEKVYNLEGSIFEWANRGFELYSNEKRVHKVHPYNSLWGRLLNRQYRSK